MWKEPSFYSLPYKLQLTQPMTGTVEGIISLKKATLKKLSRSMRYFFTTDENVWMYLVPLVV